MKIILEQQAKKDIEYTQNIASLQSEVAKLREMNQQLMSARPLTESPTEPPTEAKKPKGKMPKPNSKGKKPKGKKPKENDTS